MGEELTLEEIDDIKTDSRIERSAHYVGAGGLVVSVAATTTTSRRNFLASTPFLVIAPFWYYNNIHKGYNDFYHSATDYITGERRSRK